MDEMSACISLYASILVRVVVEAVWIPRTNLFAAESIC